MKRPDEVPGIGSNLTQAMGHGKPDLGVAEAEGYRLVRPIHCSLSPGW